MPFLFAFAFLIVLLGWPFVLDMGKYGYIATGGMWTLVGLVWFYNSSDLVSYLEGLTIAARASRLGCSGFGILLMVPVLVSVFTLSILFLIDGLVRGRRVSQNDWIKLISWFGFGIAHSRERQSRI